MQGVGVFRAVAEREYPLKAMRGEPRIPAGGDGRGRGWYEAYDTDGLEVYMSVDSVERAMRITDQSGEVSRPKAARILAVSSRPKSLP